ncbi:hypothetical protein P606_11635 [Comamonas thiooxydans]|nr:hypothetical protein P606_11635 [Comamonas thiooxydans]
MGAPYYDRKAMHRREMLGCAQLARADRKYGTGQEEAAWNERAAFHLFKLGGMAGKW